MTVIGTWAGESDGRMLSLSLSLSHLARIVTTVPVLVARRVLRPRRCKPMATAVQDVLL